MKNPFIYGKIVSGDDFCNRKREKGELARDIENSQNVIIFSQRRMGKTSLIKEVFGACRKKGVLTIYVDLYPALTEEDFVKIYAKAVAAAALGDVQRKLKNVTQFFRKIRPTFSVNREGQLSYSIDIDKTAIIPSLEDVLESTKRYADSKRRKAAVCFDEFQQIGQFKTHRIEKMMRSSFQRHKDISYIFMGSKKHLIHDMFNHPHRPFYRSAKSFPLERIGKDELMAFIEGKFQGSKKTISAAVINEIIDVCESHPYYIQYLCHIIWERAIDKKTANRKDLADSLEILLKRESSTYEATWDLLTVRQRQAMMALAHLQPEEKIFSSEFLQKHNLGSASTLQRILRSLIEKDLIDREGDAYLVIDVFFKKWLSQL